ncbi:MAG: DHH family phosphoesterase [Methanosarcinales archaeon Met12]|nr:MAG: DHH family phosphoesterase [Methanosarcinales archaeon Met12]
MLKKAAECAETLKKCEEAIIVSHIDADGLTAAGIMCMALEREGIDYTTKFLKKLDTTALNEIADIGRELVIFTDLGSTMQKEIDALNLNVIISDHHQPVGVTLEHHLNPHLFGINGTDELSGSGTAYLFAKEIGSNMDLAGLAVVGAVGDMQDAKTGRLIGMNRHNMQDGVDAGVISVETDIRLFGRQTRPVYKLLEYCSDPYIPGISANEAGCIEFLRELDIPLKDFGWRHWIHLNRDEKQRIVSKLMRLCMESGIPPYKVERIVGEVYTLQREQEGTELRDATEYSTLLNATARYGHADIGLNVCLGDRDESYTFAHNLLAQHRRNLVDGLHFVKETGVTTMKHLQYFHAGYNIQDTIIGIVAGMSASTESVDRRMPIIALADAEDGIKVSSRGTQDLIRQGLNLAVALRESAEQVGGTGGGHDIAAGATIPKGEEERFLAILDTRIGMQLK